MGREARWPYYDDWRGYGLSKGYYKINPSSLFKSKDKEKRSWYMRGMNMNKKEKWLKKFPFKRKIINGRWGTYSEWRGYGLSKGYYKINPSSLSKSKDKEKRSWYARGNKMKWLMKFKFNRKYILGRWQTYEEWEEYGIEKEYDKRNPMGLRFSKNMEERSWYGKGGTMGKENWLGRFEFERKYGRWENYKEWEEYGVKMKYNERSPSSLLRSEDNEERSWYARGNKMNKKEKWLKKFPFKRKIKQANYWQDWENFKNEMWEAINENNGEVPNYSRMIEIKKGGLQSAINKYHGGKYAILERLGYNEKMREKLARELETIVGEL